MFLFLQFIIVSSNYKAFYQDGQLWMNLSTNLTAQLRLDKQLSQFLNRQSHCTLQDAKQCYESYQDEFGRKRTLWLQREVFQNNETITYKNQSVNPTDLLSNVNYIALGPKQFYKNTLYENGFMLCLSTTDGLLQTNQNQQMSNERDVLQMLGTINTLKEMYMLKIKFIEFEKIPFDVSKFSIQISQDNCIFLPGQIFKYILQNENFQQFSFNFLYNAYVREHQSRKMPKLLLYNAENYDRPLIIEHYIDYNYQNSGYDVLLISISEKIVLGLPFLKDKTIHVQTAQNYFFIQQLYTEKCTADEVPDPILQIPWNLIIIACLFVLTILIMICWLKFKNRNARNQPQNQIQLAELQQVPQTPDPQRGYQMQNNQQRLLQ